jgi:hypothetical protein
MVRVHDGMPSEDAHQALEGTNPAIAAESCGNLHAKPALEADELEGKRETRHRGVRASILDSSWRTGWVAHKADVC